MAAKSSGKQVTRSSGNVFADLQLPNAEEKLTKVRLAVAINQILEDQRLSQGVAARRLNFLTALDQDVEIVIRRKPRSGKAGRILVTAA
jgi:hypothetical protein